MVTLTFNLWGTARLFCKVAASFYIPISTVWAFQFLYILFSTSYYLSSWLKPCYGYDILSHCGFWFAFAWWLTTVNIFPCASWSFVYFLGKMSIQILCLILSVLFVFLLLSCKSSLCIRDTRPLSDIWLVSIFSHSVGCLSFPLSSYFLIFTLI